MQITYYFFDGPRPPQNIAAGEDISVLALIMISIMTGWIFCKQCKHRILLGVLEDIISIVEKYTFYVFYSETKIHVFYFISK